MPSPFRRALAAFTRLDRLFALHAGRAHDVPSRARLEFTALEERVVPDSEPVVTLARLADGGEPGTAVQFRLARAGDAGTIAASSLTVSLQLTGSATRGVDYTVPGDSSPPGGGLISVTFAPGQATYDLSLPVLDDTLSEGWEAVTLQLQPVYGPQQLGAYYEVGTADPVSVWIADDEWWIETYDDEPVYKGQPATFWLPDGGSPALVEWDPDYNSTTFQPAAGATGTEFTTTYTTTGSRTVAVRVTGASGPAQIVTLGITVQNPPPELTVPEDFEVIAGETRPLTVTAEPGLPIVSVEWWVSYDGGDYERDTTLSGLTPDYKFTDYGDYDFWVVATDSAGGQGEGWFHVTANNAAPNGTVAYADAQGNQNGPIPEGSDVWFTVRGLEEELDLSNLDTLSVFADWYGTGQFDLVPQGAMSDYEWVFNEADWSVSFKHYYGDNRPGGSYQAVIRVQDDWGASTAKTVAVQIENVAPVATLSAGTHLANMAGSNQEVWAVYPGQMMRLDVAEPSEEDGEVLQYHWEVGGAILSNAPAVSLPEYAPGRIYSVRAWVTDKDGGSSAVFVFNAAVFSGDLVPGPGMAELETGEAGGSGAFFVPPVEGPQGTEAGFHPYGSLGTSSSPPPPVSPPPPIGPPGGPIGPIGPGGGGGGSGGAIYGTLLPTGSATPALYNRYAWMPVVKLTGIGGGNSTSS